MASSLEDLQEETTDIAIIGISGRFPAARSVQEFWHNIQSGSESVTVLSDEQLRAAQVGPDLFNHPRYVRSKPLLEDIELFDAGFFGYSPREAEIMDPQHRFFLECAWEVMENAGYTADTFAGAIGVYAGAGMNSYLLFNLGTNRDFIESVGTAQTVFANDKDYLATRVSYKLNLKGPSLTVQTACSTSLVAVHLACQSLLHAECDLALAGGVSINVPQQAGYLHEEGGILSPDGHCRAFDASAQGTVSGSGVGVVLLKRLDDALADGDTIHAVIKGSAINNDGALKAGYTAPSVDGQAQVITEALAMAEVNPETIGYVEAHGTGTPLGDPIEVLALTKAFHAHTEQTGFCALGSVKTNIGHLDAAAGVAGLIKTVLALKHQQLPPSLHFTEPNPQIDFAASPFYVNTDLRPWPRPAPGVPRRAGVSSFGIGGTNAHVILEEAPSVAAPAAAAADGPQLLVLSARTATALDTATAQLQAALAAQPELPLADVAWTLQQGRTPLAYRRTVVVHHHTEAGAALATPSRWTTAQQDGPAPRVAVLLPGQGAALGTLVPALYQEQPVFRQQLDALCQQLLPLLDRDLRPLLLPAPAEADAATTALQATALQQPALFTVQYALAQLWQAWGVRPQALLGHSLGELVAATLAGVFTLPDALTLVVRRGQLMQATAPGALLAVALDDHAVQPYLSAQVALAAVNGPRQCVLSGPTDTITALAEQLTAGGHEVRRLPGTVAFHSALMEPVQAAFTKAVTAVPRRAPQLPILSNVTGTWLTPAQATDPAYWGQHLRATVRFADGLTTLLADDAPFVLLELGPGRTLSSLARHHPAVRTDQVVSAGRHPQEATTDAATLLGALGRLWLAGVGIDWAALHHHAPRRRVPLPTYPFERQRFWVEPLPLEAQAKQHYRTADKNPDLADWFYLPSWTRTPLPILKSVQDLASPGGWLLFLDDLGLGEQLAVELNRAGHRVVRVQVGTRFARIDTDSYTIQPDLRADYERLLRELRVHGAFPDRLVHLWSLSSIQPTAPASQDFRTTQARGFFSLLALAQALSSESLPGQLRLTVVSNNVCDVSGTDPLTPEKATLLAPCMVLPQEDDRTICHYLDIPLFTTDGTQINKLTHQLLTELTSDSIDPLVAYRGSRRWTQRFEPTRLEADAAPARSLRRQGVYLITGGLDEKSLLVAADLAQTIQAKLVFITHPTVSPGHNETDTPEVANAQQSSDVQSHYVSMLEEYGAEVLLVSADLTDQVQMKAAFAQAAERFGAIHGVFHTASLGYHPLPFTSLSDIRADDFTVRFQPMINSMHVLQACIADWPIDFCVIFSSTASILGGLGTAASATASFFVDGCAAEWSKSDITPWISGNWDPWPDSESSEPKIRTSMDQYAMTTEETATALRRLVTHATVGQTIISAGALQARIYLWINRESETGTIGSRNTAAVHTRSGTQTDYVAPRSEHERMIADIWQQVLGIDQVGIYDDFFELGGHSLLAIQIVGRLRDTFNTDISLGRFFETPTIASLAQVIEHTEAEHQEQDVQDILRMLAQISDQEADEEFNKRVNEVQDS